MPVQQNSAGSGDGTSLGQSPADKISVYGVTPIPQRAGAVQAAIIDSSGGTASDTLPAIGGGYVQADLANSIATLAAKVNELRAAMVAFGIIKGGA